MSEPSSPQEISLRQAIQADVNVIRQITSVVGNNPMALAWQRFILAVDANGTVIGCGQVKPHADGTCELASIAVLPEWRGKGIARKIIEQLIAQHPGRLYLTCRSELGLLYQKFGFKEIGRAEMPPYFKRISRLVSIFVKLSNRPGRLLVMRRN